MDYKGYALPPQEEPDSIDEVCVTLRIPANPAYVTAVKAHLLELGKWWTWQREETRRGTLTAALFREKLLRTLAVGIGECPDEILPSRVWAWEFRSSQNVWQPVDYSTSEGVVHTSWAIGRGFVGSSADGTGLWAGAQIYSPLTTVKLQGRLWVRVARTVGGMTANLNTASVSISGNTSATWYLIPTLYIPPQTSLSLRVDGPLEFAGAGEYSIIDEVRIEQAQQPLGTVPSEVPPYWE